MVGARIFTPFQTTLMSTQPPVQCVPGLFPWGKAAEAWCCSTTVKEREELYLYSPLGLRGLFYGEIYLLPFHLTHRRGLYTKFPQHCKLYAKSVNCAMKCEVFRNCDKLLKAKNAVFLYRVSQT
jgi:hypothetical protein